MLKIFKNLNLRQKIALLLAPVVFIGLYFVIKEAQVNKISADDPLFVTYNGDSPPSPIFNVTNMLPGDEEEKVFNLENSSDDDMEIFSWGVKQEELKNFSEILEIEITDTIGNTYYGGSLGTKTLKDFLNETSISLGTIPANSDKDFRVKVKFPSSAGNQYQEAMIKFDIVFASEDEPITLPEECRELQGLITNVIEGTEGEDNIRGTPNNDLILLYGGDDDADGKSGHDCILGGDGEDDIEGGTGKDYIFGEDDNDKLDGGDNDDRIDGGTGHDRIRAGDNNDHITDPSGNDDIDGGHGNDYIESGSGDDEVEGGNGDDEIYDVSGTDDLDGGSDNDLIYAGTGNDKVRGGSGNDELYGEDGNDDIDGDSGDDYLNGGNGFDDLDGSSGTDECVEGEDLNSCEI